MVSAYGTIGRTVEYTGEEAYFQDSNIVWFKHDERIDNTFLKCIPCRKMKKLPQSIRIK